MEETNDPTMRTSISGGTVFHSNNLGVAYLMFGDLEQAHCLFLEAFEETSIHILAATENEESPSAQTKRPPMLPRDCLLNTLDKAFSNGDDPRNHALMITMSTQEVDNGASFSSSNDPALNDNDDDDDDNIDWCLVSAFILYNMGLLYLMFSPRSLEPSRRRRNDHPENYLSQAKMIFASAKSLLQEATQNPSSSTYSLTGNPLVDLLSLLIAFELAETTRDLEGESIHQQYHSYELFDLVFRLDAVLCFSSFYNDAEVSRLFRQFCHLLVLQYILLRGRRRRSTIYLSAAAA